MNPEISKILLRLIQRLSDNIPTSDSQRFENHILIMEATMESMRILASQNATSKPTPGVLFPSMNSTRSNEPVNLDRIFAGLLRMAPSNTAASALSVAANLANAQQQCFRITSEQSKEQKSAETNRMIGDNNQELEDLMQFIIQNADAIAESRPPQIFPRINDNNRVGVISLEMVDERQDSVGNPQAFLQKTSQPTMPWICAKCGTFLTPSWHLYKGSVYCFSCADSVAFSEWEPAIRELFEKFLASEWIPPVLDPDHSTNIHQRTQISTPRRSAKSQGELEIEGTTKISEPTRENIPSVHNSPVEKSSEVFIHQTDHQTENNLFQANEGATNSLPPIEIDSSTNRTKDKEGESQCRDSSSESNFVRRE
ncbi:hypothetical protein ACOME3_000469 [Neoechinorhynchus agilis]